MMNTSKKFDAAALGQRTFLSVATAAIALCVVTTSSPLFAIESPVVADYSLSRDETFSGTLTVNDGVTIDLAGHTLTVAGLDGNGTITSDSADTGVLRIESFADTTNSGVSLVGNLKLVKAGSGTFTTSKNGQLYLGGTEVLEGTVMRNSTHQMFGAQNLICNGGFEQATTTDTIEYTDGPEWSANPYWTCGGGGNNAGLSKNSGMFGKTDRIVGTYAAYLRGGSWEGENYGDCWFAQTFRARPGLYRLSFRTIAASQSSRRKASVQVNIIHNGATNEVLRFTADTNSSKDYSVEGITLADGGEYTLQFHQDDSETTYYVTGIDEVVFAPTSLYDLIRNGTFDASPESTNCQATAAGWPGNPCWTAGCTGSNNNFAGTVTPGNYTPGNIDVGKFAVYLRSAKNAGQPFMRQTFTVPEAGTYKLSLRHLAYYGGDYNKVRGAEVAVRIMRMGNESEVAFSDTFVATDPKGAIYTSNATIESPGEYIIEFMQATSLDYTKVTVIDDVSLCNVATVNVKTPHVTVHSGATLNLNTNKGGDWTQYPIVLDGGTLTKPGVAYLRQLLLTDDSTLNIPSTASIGHDNENSLFDLGGKTLTVNIASGQFLRIFNCTLKNGTLVSTGAGELRFGLPEGSSAATAFTSLDLNLVANTAIYPLAAVDLVDYTANYAGSGNQGTVAVNVSGVFTPNADGFYANTVLGTGATIDFTGRTKSMPLGGLTFEDGTIYLKFGEKHPANPVIAWNSAPSNLANLKFAVSPDTPIKTRLEVKSDGIYAKSAPGLVIVVK